MFHRAGGFSWPATIRGAADDPRPQTRAAGPASPGAGKNNLEAAIARRSLVELNARGAITCARQGSPCASGSHRAAARADARRQAGPISPSLGRRARAHRGGSPAISARRDEDRSPVSEGDLASDPWATPSRRRRADLGDTPRRPRRHPRGLLGSLKGAQLPTSRGGTDRALRDIRHEADRHRGPRDLRETRLATQTRRGDDLDISASPSGRASSRPERPTRTGNTRAALSDEQARGNVLETALCRETRGRRRKRGARAAEDRGDAENRLRPAS